MVDVSHCTAVVALFQVCAEHAQIDHSSFQSIEEWGQSTSGFIQQIIDENAEAVFPPDEGTLHSSR